MARGSCARSVRNAAKSAISPRATPAPPTARAPRAPAPTRHATASEFSWRGASRLQSSRLTTVECERACELVSLLSTSWFGSPPDIYTQHALSTRRFSARRRQLGVTERDDPLLYPRRVLDQLMLNTNNTSRDTPHTTPATFQSSHHGHARVCATPALSTRRLHASSRAAIIDSATARTHVTKARIFSQSTVSMSNHSRTRVMAT